MLIRMKTFGRLISLRRKELGVMQTELGARIKGCSGKPALIVRYAHVADS